MKIQQQHQQWQSTKSSFENHQYHSNGIKIRFVLFELNVGGAFFHHVKIFRVNITDSSSFSKNDYCIWIIVCLEHVIQRHLSRVFFVAMETYLKRCPEFIYTVSIYADRKWFSQHRKKKQIFVKIVVVNVITMWNKIKKKSIGLIRRFYKFRCYVFFPYRIDIGSFVDWEIASNRRMCRKSNIKLLHRYQIIY